MRVHVPACVCVREFENSWDRVQTLEGGRDEPQQTVSTGGKREES